MHANPSLPDIPDQPIPPAGQDAAEGEAVTQYMEVDGRWVRRCVQRFPSECRDHEALDVESDDFQMVPTGTAEAASRGRESHSESVSTSSPELPPQP